MSRRILLADDSVTIQKVIDLTFSEKGFEVRATSDGSSAIALLSTFEPDLVITDVHMPGASGFDVCRRAKELYPKIPVMLLVGTFEPFEESEAREAEADTFVKKPFDDQELYRAASDLLARSAPPAAVAAAVVEEAPVAAPVFLDNPELPNYPEVEEEVDLDTWDKLEIAAEAPEEVAIEETAPEPVWGNFDDALEAAAVAEATPSPFSSYEEPAAEPALWAPEPQEAASMPAWTPTPAPEEPVFAAASSIVAASSETVLFDIPTMRPAAPAAPAPAAAVAPVATLGEDFSLSDSDVERIARRVVELLSEKTVRDVAWEVVPDVAELVVRDRIKELEAEVEAAAV